MKKYAIILIEGFAMVASCAFAELLPVEIYEKGGGDVGYARPRAAEALDHLEYLGRLVRNRLQLVRETQQPPCAFGRVGRQTLDHHLPEKFRDLALDVVQDRLAMDDMLFVGLVGGTGEHATHAI